MIDPFLLLTPILLLPIIWLLRFTGCAAILGIDDVTYASLFAVKTTSPLPGGNVGIPYPPLQLEATGGIGNLTWVGTPPAGLTLSPTGLLQGIPLKEFNAQFTVNVTDSGPHPQKAEASFRLTIAPPPPGTIVKRINCGGQAVPPDTSKGETLRWEPDSATAGTPGFGQVDRPKVTDDTGALAGDIYETWRIGPSGTGARKFDQPDQAVHVNSSGNLTITFQEDPQVGTFPIINAIEVKK